MPPSIDQVARRANVSISTVSRVVNRRNVVSEKTRHRVELAIKELGYQPNAFARGLMLRKSEMVGLVLPDLHGEFYSEIIRGANMQARQLGYSLVIASARDTDDAQSLLHGFHGRSIMDGLAIMVSEVTGGIQEVLGTFRLPFVVLDDDIDGADHDSVTIDQLGGARAMMRHLVETCRVSRVFFLGGLETNVDTIARLKAYRQVLGEHQVPFSASDIYHLDYRYETAWEFARQHVSEWVGERHCVFAANDEMASGVVDAAAAAGVKVPEDLAVVGFDDTRVARMTRPPLTTVRVPMAQMGAKAIELLCSRLADPAQPADQVSLQPELIVRESCGANVCGAG
ncbi:MAG: LacI family transcriptional regulator [bacterium]|nr:LacI family transcriptional regulator [bacterium]